MTAVALRRALRPWFQRQVELTNLLWQTSGLEARSEGGDPYFWPFGWRQDRNAIRLAQDLARAPGFRSVHLALVLEQPSAGELRALVQRVLPAVISDDAVLLADALTIAYSPSRGARCDAVERAARSLARRSTLSASGTDRLLGTARGFSN